MEGWLQMRLANGKVLDFVEVSALQHESEISEMLNVILAHSEVQSAIEIGTFEGATAHVWAQLVSEFGGLVHCIDVQFGSDHKAAPEWTNRCQPVYRDTPFAANVVEIEGESQDPEVVAKVALSLGGRKVDFLFIDGNHNYGPAKADYWNYAAFVRPGGWIAFHDIKNKTWGVSELWEEIKGQQPSWEFCIHDQPDDLRKTHRDMGFVNGIGLIRWGEE